MLATVFNPREINASLMPMANEVGLVTVAAKEV